MGAAAKWISTAVDLFYPRNCPLCGVNLKEHEAGVVCGECLSRARLIEPPFCQRCALPFDGAIPEPFVCGHCHKLKFHFTRAVAACRAEGVVRDCIHRFKYRREYYFGQHLAGWLAGATRRWLDVTNWGMIIPVPLHPRKRREREFNQSEWLAHALGHELNVPVVTSVLRRVVDTQSQTFLGAEERAANMRKAFAVRHGERVKGHRVLLVDDVFTTGATLDGCARVLTASGATEVVAVTVARGT